MTYILYGSRGSGSAAVEMALRACGIAWTAVEASSWQRTPATEQLARLNPLVQIPTVQLPDGTVITESAAILLHLALAAPQGRLLPESPSARSQALRGLVFIAANCYAAVGMVDFPERWTTASAESAREEVREASRRRLFECWDIFADTFAAQPYLSGDVPGALDFLAVVVSTWSRAREHIAASRPLLTEALQRIEAHERVQPIFHAHFGKAPQAP
jgi:GST-like protein